MIFVVPLVKPVTTPVLAPTLATVGLDELQEPVPPPSSTPLAVYVGVFPIQSGEVPVTEVIAAAGLTVKDTEPLRLLEQLGEDWYDALTKLYVNAPAAPVAADMVAVELAGTLTNWFDPLLILYVTVIALPVGLVKTTLGPVAN